MRSVATTGSGDLIVYPMTEEQWEPLFREHYPGLVRFAVALTGDEELARDLAQESFVRVWRVRDRVRDAEAVPAYLRTTLLNLARGSFRRRALELRHHLTLRSDPSSTATDARLDLLRAVSALPLRQRACIVLRYLEDRSEADVAGILGVSVGTVKTHAHRALDTLHRLLGGTDEP